MSQILKGGENLCDVEGPLGTWEWPFDQERQLSPEASKPGAAGRGGPRPAAARTCLAPSGAVRLSRTSLRSCWPYTRLCVLGPTVRGASVFASDLHTGGVKPACSDLLQVVLSLLFLLPPPTLCHCPRHPKTGRRVPCSAG